MQKNEIIKNLSIPQKILIKNSKKKNNNNNYPNLTNSNKIKTISDCFTAEYVGNDKNGILILVLSADKQHIKKIKGNFYEIVQHSSSKSKELDLICRISYSNIKEINWDGDNYENCPHIICDFNELDHTPYNDMFYAEQKTLNGLIIYRKIVSIYNILNPLIIKDILKIYENYNEDIVIDLQDQDYSEANNIYYELLKKEISQSKLNVNLRHGKVISNKFGLPEHSAYNIDWFLYRAYNKSNNDLLSSYFKNRKLL